MNQDEKNLKVPDFSISSQEFFHQAVNDACEERGLKTIPHTKTYVVNLLTHYMFTSNLFDEEDVSGKKRRDTLAEMFLKAGSAQRSVRIELLKKLGDTALYMSGFFSQSLQRKIVDLDYYMEMGETAYSSLARSVEEDTTAKVYGEISGKFMDFVDVLSLISSKSLNSTKDNLLHLFEKYVTTGSSLAQDQLLDQGVITVPSGVVKGYKQ